MINALNYLWILTLINMQVIDFQNFIGKNINEIKTIRNNKLKYNSDLNKYYIFSDVGYEFYSKTYHNVTIVTDEKDIIKNITIYMEGIIDKTFYNAFNNNYSLPNNIMVVDTIKSLSGHRHIGEGQLESYSMEQNISLKKGEFDEKPVLLVWKKEKFQITIFLKYDINISEIKFSLPTD